MTSSKKQLVEALHDFARTTSVFWSGSERSWLDHTAGGGHVDEKPLVEAKAFPEFAQRFLGWNVGVNLATETTDDGARPDFIPADRVTHQFVMEVKGTSEGLAPAGRKDQIERYFKSSATKWVVVTNMVAIRVFVWDAKAAGPQLEFEVNLRALWTTPVDQAVNLPDADRLAKFVERFSFQDLDTDEKIDRIRQAGPWDDVSDHSTATWLRHRIDVVVRTFHAEVQAQVSAGSLGKLLDDEREAIADELRGMMIRAGMSADKAGDMSLDEIVADTGATAKTAVEQYTSNVAYWLTTKLVLVRIWEDLKRIEPARLYDGGFNDAMDQFGGAVDTVIREAFKSGEHIYRALFAQRPVYSWFEPSREAAVDALYELAFTYMADVSSDVLGEVYEQTLARIDRKSLGQYYTPRDIIGLIWDLTAPPEFIAEIDAQDRPERVLDIATGSGGFLVEGAVRRRNRLRDQIDSGAQVDPAKWIADTAKAFTGIEKQRFSAFLAELNLLIQISRVDSVHGPAAAIPELGIIPADTLTLHDPFSLEDVDTGEGVVVIDEAFDFDVKHRRQRAEQVMDPKASDSWFDLAIGNPPYIGEKLAAGLTRTLREKHPYWTQFTAPHADYLYNFLILGISKLNVGGRFGFITTEYWLRSVGAAPLRQYMSERCQIDNLILFRNMRLFPDAPGQHNLIVTGTVVTHEPTEQPAEAHLPRVSIYTAANPSPSPKDRAAILQRLSSGQGIRNKVTSFTSRVSPNDIGRDPWVEVTLTRQELATRRRIQKLPQLGELDASEGVIATPQTATAAVRRLLPAATAHTLAPRAGIFELSPDEVAALGLSQNEMDAVRRVIDTKDVLPYAAVPPDDAKSLLYLPSR